MEILTPDKYDEYESFAKTHKNGGITQSVNWCKVKGGWGQEIVISRGANGEIVGGMSVLIRKMPAFGVSMLYAPRGPVCDPGDRAVLEDLKSGADKLAKKYKAYLFKMDPEIAADDEKFISMAREMGFVQFKGGTGFETVQARFNYRVYLDGRDENALLMNLNQKTRYNVRVAEKRGVTVRVMGEDALDDFMRLMTATGERDGFAIRPREYFAGMLRSLGEHVRLYMAYYDGKAVSGAITTNYAGKTCYIYGASDNEHRNVMPNYLIQWEMIRWAAQTGCSVYDMQGISGDMENEGDPLYGLYRFKRGFGGQVDELAGEFDFIYRPAAAKLIDAAMNARERLLALKKKSGGN